MTPGQRRKFPSPLFGWVTLPAKSTLPSLDRFLVFRLDLQTIPGGSAGPQALQGFWRQLNTLTDAEHVADDLSLIGLR
jgi:hypothetical protein